jgi:sulfur-oxidizing protein SoxB
MGYTINVDAAMGSRITGLHLLRNGVPVEPAKEYVVAGWASVTQGVEGPPVWDVVATHLKDRQVVAPQHREQVHFLRAER